MAKLIMCNVPSTNIRKARAFYSLLFPDLPLARSLTENVEAYHEPISSDGIQLTITPRQVAEEQITCYFAVDNLDETLNALEKAGGTVVVEAFNLEVGAGEMVDYAAQVKQYHPEVGTATSSIGQSAVVRDPDGNLIGLTQLTTQANWLFKYGSYRTPLAADQVAQHQRGIALGANIKTPT